MKNPWTYILMTLKFLKTVSSPVMARNWVLKDVCNKEGVVQNGLIAVKIFILMGSGNAIFIGNSAIFWSYPVRIS